LSEEEVHLLEAFLEEAHASGTGKLACFADKKLFCYFQPWLNLDVLNYESNSDVGL
jgi:hypothetical protein